MDESSISNRFNLIKCLKEPKNNYHILMKSLVVSFGMATFSWVSFKLVFPLCVQTRKFNDY